MYVLGGVCVCVLLLFYFSVSPIVPESLDQFKNLEPENLKILECCGPHSLCRPPSKCILFLFKSFLLNSYWIMSGLNGPVTECGIRSTGIQNIIGPIIL